MILMRSFRPVFHPAIAPIVFRFKKPGHGDEYTKDWTGACGLESKIHFLLNPGDDGLANSANAKISSISRKYDEGTSVPQ